MIKRLLNIEKKYMVTTIFTTFMDWFDIFIFAQIVNIMLKLYANIEILKITYSLLITSILFYSIYKLFLEKKFINIWYNNAYIKIKEMYFKSIFEGPDKRNIVQIIQSDIKNMKRLGELYNIVFPAAIKFILGIILFTLLAIFYKSYLLFVIITYFLVLGISMSLFGKSVSNVNRRYMGAFLSLGNRFLDDLSGINTLIMYNQDELYYKKFKDDSENFRVKTMELLSKQLQTLFILNCLIFLFILIGAIISVLQVKAMNITLLQAVTLFVIFARNLLITREIGFSVHIVKSAMGSLKSVFETIDSHNPKNSYKKSIINVDNITFNNVSFAYNQEKPIINNFNYTFNKGNIYKIVGKNGEGKSTIFKLIKGIIKATNGEISLNDININEITYGEKNELIGSLNTTSYLFEGSIRDNLKIFNKNIEKEIEKYNLLNFVDNLKDGLDTQVGEDGKLISPGQKQQIAFFRLLLSDKQIFMLDEFVSSVNRENVNKIMNALNQVKDDKIILIITHDLKHLLADEKILYLSNGKIIESTHKELIENNNEYKELYEMKVGENDI
ncbi:MAG: ATP-binding cassette domain-containing protein [Helcococcus sp.]|nr:ATP-binding cassette domain-containing protein [Helcococcus sp.]